MRKMSIIQKTVQLNKITKNILIHHNIKFEVSIFKNENKIDSYI